MPNANAPRPSRCSMRPMPHASEAAERLQRVEDEGRRLRRTRRTARSTIPCRRCAGSPRSSPPRCRTPRAPGVRRRTDFAGRLVELAAGTPLAQRHSGVHCGPAPGRQRLRRSVPAGGDRRTRPQESRHDCGFRGQQAGRGAVCRDRQTQRRRADGVTCRRSMADYVAGGIAKGSPLTMAVCLCVGPSSRPKALAMPPRPAAWDATGECQSRA